MHGSAKNAADITAMGVAAGTVFDALPDIAALCAILWYIMRFYEYLRHKHLRKERKELYDNYCSKCKHNTTQPPLR